MIEQTKGFWQIIDKGDEVLLQTRGLSHQEQEIREKRWHIKPEDRLRFVIESDYVQPENFFAAYRKGTLVTVYDDLVDVEEHLELSSRGDTPQDLDMRVLPIEGVEKLQKENWSFVTWSAFIDDQWVGTSEY